MEWSQKSVWGHRGADIKIYVKDCIICMKTKPENHPNAVPLSSLKVTGKYKVVSVDFIEDYPVGNRQAHCAMTFFCYGR